MAHSAQVDAAQTELQHQQLVDLVRAILWRADARTFDFTFVSRQAEAVLGYPVRRWLERGFLAAHLHPDDREATLAYCAKATAARQPHEFEFRMLAADGRVVWLREIVQVLGENGQATELIGVMIDVTERRRAEEALRTSEHQFRTLFESTMLGMGIADQDFRFLKVNRAFCQLLGYSESELVGRTFLEVTHPDDVGLSRVLAERTFRGEIPSYQIEKRYIRKDGSVVQARLSVSVVRDDRGQPLYFQGIVEDITERSRIEEELRRSRAQLRDLAARLEAAREEERAHMAREIHDQLGQALTALKMDVAWLKKRLPTRAQAVTRKRNAMAALIDATMESMHRLAAELRPGVLDELGLPAAIHWLAHDWEQRTGIPCRAWVSSDDVRLEAGRSTAAFRILQEALSNVARHAGATEVEIRCSISAQGLELVVRDDGRGITDAELTASDALGLLGMRERAQTWGGEVSIRGDAKRGTTVTLRLPLDGRAG